MKLLPVWKLARKMLKRMERREDKYISKRKTKARSWWLVIRRGVNAKEPPAGHVSFSREGDLRNAWKARALSGPNRALSPRVVSSMLVNSRI